MAVRVQILEESVFIPHSANSLQKGMQPIIFPSAIVR